MLPSSGRGGNYTLPALFPFSLYCLQFLRAFLFLRAERGTDGMSVDWLTLTARAYNRHNGPVEDVYGFWGLD